jgi:hypothetical protein
MGRNRCCASDDARVRLADVAPVPGVAHRDVQVGDVRLHVAEAGSELHVPEEAPQAVAELAAPFLAGEGS